MKWRNIVTLLRDGWTSLMKSSSRGYDKVVDVLIKNGAEVDAVDE